MKRVTGLLAVLLVGACIDPKPSPKPSAAAIQRPNVLLITIDTLRADHLGAYGYKRPTSPNIDVLAREGALFERAYTYWPKTRASFIVMLTGRHPSLNGYTQRNRVLFDFNPTLASVLKEGGFTTSAVVDNSNVAASLGYAKGFDTYRETWEEKALPTEIDRARAISSAAIQNFAAAGSDKPFFLWLHYVNPHAPYTPPAPYDKAFLAGADQGPRLQRVADYMGGVHRSLAVKGRDRLGYYVGQYDGEIAFCDAEVGRVLDALRSSRHAANTIVILTSDHGESLGEHGYYFDHGANLMDPCLRIPFIVKGPGVPPASRNKALVSTIDFVPTVLDAVKVSYPPDLGGLSFWPVAQGGKPPRRERLFAQNDRGHWGTHDGRFKLVGQPEKAGTLRYSLFDRQADPGETRDVARGLADDFGRERRAMELFREQRDREATKTASVIEKKAGRTERPLSKEACENLQSLGYVDGNCNPVEIAR
jgi:arylsulfatase A-like enzyme